MPPVDDIPIHHKVIKTRRQAGCFDQPRDGIPCRQVGRRHHSMGGGHYLWADLPECEGCQAERDHEYIATSRYAIDKDSSTSMKADQR